MIEPIGPSLLCGGTSLICSGNRLIFSGTSLSQSGARRQLVYDAGPDPWSSPDVSPFDGHVAPASDENHIRHFHIFIRNTDISLRSCSRIANMFDGVFSLLHQILHPDGVPA
jgi:hypothetical protein